MGASSPFKFHWAYGPQASKGHLTSRYIKRHLSCTCDRPPTASLQVSGPKLSDTISPISSCPWRYLPRETIRELWCYVCPGDVRRPWYIPVILLNPGISLYSFMEIFTALEMTVFFLKISSDGQSFHFMVYERPGILRKRSSFTNIEKTSLSLNERMPFCAFSLSR